MYYPNFVEEGTDDQQGPAVNQRQHTPSGVQPGVASAGTYAAHRSFIHSFVTSLLHLLLHMLLSFLAFPWTHRAHACLGASVLAIPSAWNALPTEVHLVRPLASFCRNAPPSAPVHSSSSSPCHTPGPCPFSEEH